MTTNKHQEDRYTTFLGISCDAKANELITLLESNLEAGKGEQRWQDYFAKKRQEQASMQKDNLNFIGHQTNALYEYFNDCKDEEANALLYKIEQQCC